MFIWVMSVICVCHYFEFLFKNLKKLLFANSGEPDQTPRFANVPQKGRYAYMG